MLQLITPPHEVPRLSCRCCNQPLTPLFQKGLLPNRPGYYLVTCWNEGGCTLYGYTLSARDYQTRDLSAYGFIPALDKNASTEPTI